MLACLANVLWGIVGSWHIELDRWQETHPYSFVYGGRGVYSERGYLVLAWRWHSSVHSNFPPPNEPSPRRHFGWDVGCQAGISRTWDRRSGRNVADSFGNPLSPVSVTWSVRGMDATQGV